MALCICLWAASGASGHTEQTIKQEEDARVASLLFHVTIYNQQSTDFHFPVKVLLVYTQSPESKPSDY